MNSALKLLVNRRSVLFSVNRLLHMKNSLKCTTNCTVPLYRSLTVPTLFCRSLASYSFVPEKNHVRDSSGFARLDHLFSIAHKSVMTYGRLSPEDVTSLIKESKLAGSLSYAQSLFLIRCLGSPLPEATTKAKSKMLDQVLGIFKSHEIPLDITHYNHILAVYLENEVIYNPIEFLAMLENKNIAPNKVTFQKMVSSLCQMGDVTSVTEILHIMKERNLGINTEVLNAIVKGHSLNGDWESAQQTIESISSMGLEPDAKTYCGLIEGYAKRGSLKPISSVMDQCKTKEIFIRDKDLLDVSYVAAVNGHFGVLDYLLSLARKDFGYNRICVNLIFRLITNKHEDAAFKVLLSMKPVVSSDGRTLPSGNFFIRHLVKSACPPEKIIHFCQELVATGRNSRAFFKALEVATIYNEATLVALLMRKIQGSKDSAKPHLFAPLLASKARVSGEEGVLSFLWEMKSMGAGATVDTVTRYILPHLTGDVETLLRKLLDAGISFYVSVVSLLRHSVECHDFNSAIWLATNYYTGFDTTLRNAVVKAYLESRDAPSLSKLLRALLPQPREIDEDDDLQDSSNQLIDCLLKEISSQSQPPELFNVIYPSLKELNEQGLSISVSTSQHLRETFSEENQSLDALLSSLESNKLVHFAGASQRFNVGSETAVKSVKDFNRFARCGDMDSILKCKEVLEAKNVPLTDGMNVSLMMAHLKNDSTDEALSIFTKLLNDGVKLNMLNLLSLTTHLLKKQRAEDALYTLEHADQSRTTLEAGDRTRNAILRVLNVAASQGDAELTRKIFDQLKGRVEITRSLLSPLIKVHLVRGNLSDAVDELKRCVDEYRCAPWKSRLFEKCIEHDDSARLLSRVVELSNKVDGEMNTLHDLAFAYLQCGRRGQADSVFKTPGLRALNNRLDDACRYYASNSRVREMEDLLSVTRHVFNADRLMLYGHVLDAYVAAGDAAKALALWERMQCEQEVAPDDEFLLRLGKFLLANSCRVPFVLPSIDASV